jgi:hypothetical protein
LTSFSQTVTSSKSVTDTCKVIIPCDIARKVAVDLVRGDSARAELAITQDLLEVVEAKVIMKDQIIDLHIIKEQNYNQQINLYKEKENYYTHIVTGLEGDNKKLKKKVGLLRAASSVLLVTTLFGLSLLVY